MYNRAKNAKISMLLTVLTLLVAVLAACGAPSQQKVVKTAFLLDTEVSVTTYDPKSSAVIDECLDLCAQYEQMFSRTDPDSELYALNAAGSAAVSDELLSVIKTALSYCQLSGGRFDITMGGVSALYGFSSSAPAVPTAADIQEQLSHTGWENIVIDGNTVTLTDPEAVIDLGAIAKGYIADRLAELLVERGVTSAIIDLGGNILCVGSKPDGSDFNVGIQFPYEDSSTIIATAKLSNMSVVTSGVYQRYFEEDGVTYHHILDPDTGYPIRNNLLSVTIISEKSVDCDALSTTVFALGLEEGMELVDGLDGVWAAFITEDFEVHYSQGFEEQFG